MKNLKYILILLLLGCTLASCSRQTYPTGREADSRRSQREKAAAYSQILGFRVTTKDDLRFYGEVVSWLGTPYRYGGNSRAGVDCSGLVRNVYRNVYKVPIFRTVETMYEKNTSSVPKGSARTGDLIFFSRPGSRALSHVGIYLKDGYFVHASTSRGVVIDRVREGYFKDNWRKTGRVR